MKKNKAHLYKYINKRISKFYLIDEPDELIYDMDTDACEEMSEDEWQEDHSELLQENNQKISLDHSENIRS